MIKRNIFDIGEVALNRLLILVVMSALVACQREEVNPAAVPPQAASVASTPVAVIVPLSLPPVTSAVEQSTPVKPSVVTKSIEAAKPAKIIAGVSAGAPVAANIAPAATVAVAAITSAQPAPEKLLPTALTVEAKAPAAMSDADGIALAKKRNCFACHMVDKKIVGPAWKDVAAKYRGDAGAQVRLEAKISKGGSKVWGNMAMPAQPQVTADERALLARFILNLK